MKAWFIDRIGEPRDVLTLRDAEKRDLADGEVRIQLKAAALNFFDILQCQGKYQEKHEPPFTPGAEMAGIVEESKSAEFKVGQKVLAIPLLPNGGLAQFVTVHERDVFAIPEEMSFESAAALFITYQTAYYALHNRGGIQAGDVLLVHAGAGGVGSAAIQLGKSAGAYIIATAGSDDKLDICKKLGADQVINYRTESFMEVVKEATKGAGADLIFDPVGGDVFDQSRKCIAFEGRILTIGFAGGRIPEAPVNHALIKNYSIVGVHFGLFRKLYPAKVKQLHEELMQLFRQGKINPLIYGLYDFEQVPDALDELADRQTYGKLIVANN